MSQVAVERPGFFIMDFTHPALAFTVRCPIQITDVLVHDEVVLTWRTPHSADLHYWSKFGTIINENGQ